MNAARSGTALSLALLLLLSALSAGAAVVEAISAVVDGRIITRSEVEGTMTTFGFALGDDEARKKVLEGLIEQRLVEDRAEKMGIKVSEEEIENAVRRTREKLGLDPLQFDRALSRQGLTLASYSARLGSDMLRSRVFGRSMNKDLKVDDKRLREYYLKNTSLFRLPSSVRLLHLVTPSGTGEAQLIRKQTLEGADFVEAAKNVAGREPMDTGMMGEDTLSEDFRAAITNTPAGSPSEVIPTGDGDYLLFVSERKEGNLPPFEEVRDQVQKLFTSEGEFAIYRNWIEQLKRNAKIERMN